MTDRSFFRLEVVKARTGLSRSEIYRRIRDGAFPKAIILGRSTKPWDSFEVSAWLDRMAATAPREEA